MSANNKISTGNIQNSPTSLTTTMPNQLGKPEKILKSNELKKQNQFLTVLISLTLFIIVFAIAFFIASQSGNIRGLFN